LTPLIKLSAFVYVIQPSPGLQSRPDRILVSRDITVEDTSKAGNGTDFMKYYYTSVIVNRAKSVLRSSYHAFTRQSGYSCVQDCGPHGSCRCGICVSGGNQNNCNIPDCTECTRTTFLLFLAILIPLIISCLLLFLIILKILIVSAKVKPQDIFDILGYRCCLFNQTLFSWSAVPRRYKSKMNIILYIFKLPPMLVLIFMLASIMFLLSLCLWVFYDGIQLVYFLLPEELFPSDHLIVLTRLSL
jgi:hypothetical protein